MASLNMAASVASSVRRAAVGSHCSQPTRGMATLKDIRLRLTSVKNIQKITKSMKMVSAAKYNRADRDLRNTRGVTGGINGVVDSSGVTVDGAAGRLLIAMSSDRGLCGGIHSTITKAVQPVLKEDPKANVFVLGDRVKSQLQRISPGNIAGVFTDVGKRPPTFAEASEVAQKVFDSDIPFEKGQVLFNKFKSVISYTPTSWTVVSPQYLQDAEELNKYELVEDETTRSYAEFHLAQAIYGAMVEAAASEQSARMQAMENATKNAGEMIDRLTLAFNRTRQAVITNELIEIISGAAAV